MRRKHADDVAARNLTAEYMPFDTYFRHVFGRAAPKVIFVAQGAQFAASGDCTQARASLHASHSLFRPSTCKR